MSSPIKLYANLHLHSTHSDGAFTPEELVRTAYEEGYHAIALTDHDTYTGNAPVREECKKYGMESIYGTEFSTKQGFHLTAFHFDPEEPGMKEYLYQLSEKETDQTRVLFHRGVEIGYIKNITWDEVLEYNEGISWLCNEHVFRAMKAKGLITDLEYPTFFETVYGPHRSEVPPIYEWRDAAEVISLVRNAGGICCIAHPHKQLHRVESLVEAGLNGIEVFHSMLTGEEHMEALRLAKKHNLYVSGGSDHEGLCGGEYARYEHPEETIFWLEPLEAGTTKYFYEEIRDMTLRPERNSVIDDLLSIDIWNRYTGWRN